MLLFIFSRQVEKEAHDSAKPYEDPQSPEFPQCVSSYVCCLQPSSTSCRSRICSPTSARRSALDTSACIARERPRTTRCWPSDNTWCAGLNINDSLCFFLASICHKSLDFNIRETNSGYLGIIVCYSGIICVFLVYVITVSPLHFPGTMCSGAFSFMGKL